jgi:hypothetical protein
MSASRPRRARLGGDRTRSTAANAVNAAAMEATATTEAAADTDDREDALSMLATTILNTICTDVLEASYDRQTPDENLIGASRAFSVSDRLNQLMESCPAIDPVAGVDFLRQHNCAWAQAIGSRLKQDETERRAGSSQVHGCTERPKRARTL